MTRPLAAGSLRVLSAMAAEARQAFRSNRLDMDDARRLATSPWATQTISRVCVVCTFFGSIVRVKAYGGSIATRDPAHSLSCGPEVVWPMVLFVVARKTPDPAVDRAVTLETAHEWILDGNRFVRETQFEVESR